MSVTNCRSSGPIRGFRRLSAFVALSTTLPPAFSVKSGTPEAQMRRFLCVSEREARANLQAVFVIRGARGRTSTDPEIIRSGLGFCPAKRERLARVQRREDFARAR